MGFIPVEEKRRFGLYEKNCQKDSKPLPTKVLSDTPRLDFQHSVAK